jgi:uncharacterized protein YbjT (DUF2867 family)
MNVCIVGASGKLGQYMVQDALDRGYEVVGVCREQSVPKLDRFKGRISVIPGATNDRAVIRGAVAGCDGVLTVLNSKTLRPRERSLKGNQPPQQVGPRPAYRWMARD